MKILFLLLFFIPLVTYAQFSEDWNDIIWSDQTTWHGTTDKFEITDSKQLQLNAASEASEAYLFRECLVIDETTWNFSVELSFNPSSANYAIVYLVSNQLEYTDDIEGYFIKIGDTQDEISLWKRVNGSNTKIIDGTDKVITESTSVINVTVFRDNNGNWSINATINGTSIDIQTGFDDSITQNNYTGLYCKYTSTRSTGFTFGNFSVDGIRIVDEEPPTIVSYSLINGKTLQIEFSESIQEETVNTGCFQFDNVSTIESILINDTIITLLLKDYLNDTDNGQLTISTIQDMAGNVMASTQLEYEYSRIHLLEHSIIDHQTIEFVFSEALNQEAEITISIPDNPLLYVEYTSNSSLTCSFEKSFPDQIPQKVDLKLIEDIHGDLTKDSTIQITYQKPIHEGYTLYEEWIYPELSDQNEWIGDTAYFKSRSAKLNLNAPEEGNMAKLFHRSEAIDNTTWEIQLNMPFNPSSSNQAQIFLCANQCKLDSLLEGYYLIIGDAEDDISLWKRINNTDTKILDGIDNCLANSNNEIQITVTRDTLGNWSLESTINSMAQTALSANDYDIKNAQYFGIVAYYTSTRKTALQFGTITIKGDAYTDTTSPRIRHHEISNGKTLLITFNEPINTNTINTNHIIAPNDNLVKRFSYHNDSLTIAFESYLKNDTIGQIHLSQICDTTGNTMTDTTLIYNYHKPERYDVMITELMTDATPSMGLPESEYIELYNLTAIAFNIENWRLVINDDKDFLIPNYKLQPYSYAILTNEEYSDSTHAITLDKTIDLSKTSGKVYLISNENSIIDAIEYPFNINETSFKDDGGWSFEKIDYNNPQLMGNNWGYSMNLDGGTPGQLNSILDINSDDQQPVIKNICYQNDSTFTITFSEAMDTSTIENIDLDLIHRCEIDSVFLNQITFHLNSPLDTNQIYSFQFDTTPSDFSGNQLIDDYTLQFGIPCVIDSSDIIINELLFNPYTEGSDFIELYNHSDKILNSNDIYLARKVDNQLEKLFQINASHQLIYPNTYVVISADTAYIREQYPNAIRENLMQATIPSLPDDAGNIALCNHKGIIWDYFEYHEDMHHSLLINSEGVSLERINDNLDITNDNNWHSASSNAGYATPTQQNSQYRNLSSQTNDAQYFWVDNNEFTPNNDGYNDVAYLYYKTETQGWLATIKIYNSLGQLVKILANSELLSSNGVFVWDGTSDNNNRCSIGAYIVYISLYNTNGNIHQEKIVLILSPTTNH